jgi:hypothetical protein
MHPDDEIETTDAPTAASTVDPTLSNEHYLRQIALNHALGLTHPGQRLAKQVVEDAKVFFDFLTAGTVPA